MINVRSTRQKGLSLIFVLLLIVGLSSLLIHQANIRKIKEDRRAFEFTLAQTQNMLNLANAYRLDQGHWPRANQGGACETLSSMASDNNGWGYPIQASGNCNGNNASYTLAQIIPNDYYDPFDEYISDNVSRNSAGAPAGYTRLSVTISRSSVSGNAVMEMKRFSNSYYQPGPYFDYMLCDSGSPQYVAGLDSMCAHIEEKSNSGFPLFYPFSTPTEPSIIGGFKIRVSMTYSGPQVEYDVRMDNYIWPRYEDKSSGDHLDFAYRNCPTGSSGSSGRIKALFLAWCD